MVVKRNLMIEKAKLIMAKYALEGKVPIEKLRIVEISEREIGFIREKKAEYFSIKYSTTFIPWARFYDAQGKSGYMIEVPMYIKELGFEVFSVSESLIDKSTTNYGFLPIYGYNSGFPIGKFVNAPLEEKLTFVDNLENYVKADIDGVVISNSLILEEELNLPYQKLLRILLNDLNCELYIEFSENEDKTMIWADFKNDTNEKCSEITGKDILFKDIDDPTIVSQLMLMYDEASMYSMFSGNENFTERQNFQIKLGHEMIKFINNMNIPSDKLESFFRKKIYDCVVKKLEKDKDKLKETSKKVNKIYKKMFG